MCVWGGRGVVEKWVWPKGEIHPFSRGWRGRGKRRYWQIAHIMKHRQRKAVRFDQLLWITKDTGQNPHTSCSRHQIPSDPHTSWIVFYPATLSFPRAYYFFHISQPAKICLKNRCFEKKFHWVPLYFRSSLLSLHPKTYFSGGDKQIYVGRRRVRRLRCEHHGRPNLCTAKARGCMNMLYLGRHFLQVRVQVTSLQINKQE